MQSSITLAAFLTFFSGALPLPQVEVRSLPEIARRIRSAQTGTETQGPVFTNENIGQAQAALSIVRASNPPETPNPAAESAQAETAATAAPARTEDEWRAAFVAARAAITEAEELAQLTEQELQTLNFRLLTESGLFNREGQLLPLITAKKAEFETNRENIVSANAALTDLTEELRRSGAPRGWGRQ